jgi:hypothetical protein
MLHELEVKADPQAELPEGMVGFGGGATTEIPRAQLTASLLACVFLDSTLLVGFMRVQRFHVLFLELGQVISIEFAFLLFLLEGVVEHLG